MEASKPQVARPPRARNNGRAKAQESSSSSSSSGEEAPARRSTDSSSSEAESTSSEASSSASESMPPPPLPRVYSTPPGSVIQDASAGASTSGSQQDEEIETRPSRSESTASRTNRLSLTLPIAPPTSFPSRPTPASSTVASFPGTPIDLDLVSPAEPADLITAIAAQERRVLELREELSRAERGLSKLKKQWTAHESNKKLAEIRKTEPMRSMSSRPGTAGAAVLHSPAASVDEATSKRNSELDRRKALLLGQQPGSQSGSETNTPTQSRRRVFRGGHARTLSLLSPTKSSSDGFAVHEDQTADAEEGSIKSPLSPLDMDSPFMQNLNRYAPAAATQLSKRASWAPQSAQQVKQVAGDLTTTLWNFVEDLRQATVGEELVGNGGNGGTMRTIDPNSRATDDSTIRASASGRPHLSRAFTTDLQGTPTPPPRPSAAASSSEQQAESKGKTKTSASSSKSKTSKAASKSATGKDAKRFSWTPLTVDSYDDNDWSSWDSPTVKSPRWSGSTAGETTATSIPEQADENTTPQYVKKSRAV
ncbi:hypothetical protein SEUCBS140593_000456 [Sporothrix eucalyptigena]|uniref:DUF4048 domain-containing protein n=1 Tax=Sporothrix eucalyptigena TaxID=1812306 RepID=A0ABP0AQ24_9PEZI